MKRALSFTIAASLCACLFAFDAEVTSLSGKAQFSLNGTSWSAISVGTKIPQGAAIQTGFKSELALKLKGTELKLEPMTRITLDELSEKGNKDNAVVSMKIGGLTSNVKKLEDRRAGFTVKGPAATASVRGTVLSEECGYNKDTVSAIESTTMVWPSSSNEAADARLGDEDSDSDDGNASAAKGAVAIAPGQISSVNSDNGQRSPQSHAVAQASDMGGASSRAAMQEGVSPGGPGGMGGPGGLGPLDFGSGSSNSSVGRLNVIVDFED